MTKAVRALYRQPRRDIAIGVPVLLSWQALEIRRPLRRRREAPNDQALREPGKPRSPP